MLKRHIVKKRESIEKYRDELELNSEAEAVKWFGNTGDLLVLKYFDSPHTEKCYRPLAEIIDVNYMMKHDPTEEIYHNESLNNITEKLQKEFNELLTILGKPMYQ